MLPAGSKTGGGDHWIVLGGSSETGESVENKSQLWRTSPNSPLLWSVWCKCVPVGASIHVWKWTWKPDVDIGVSHCYLPPHLLRQRISLNPEISCADQLSRVAGQPWRIASLYFSTVRSTDTLGLPWALWRGRYLNSHSCVCVCGGPFTDRAVSLAPGSSWCLNIVC